MKTREIKVIIRRPYYDVKAGAAFGRRVLVRTADQERARWEIHSARSTCSDVEAQPVRLPFSPAMALLLLQPLPL